MPYTTGTAVSFTAMRTALVNACVADGWTWDSGNEVIYKGTIYAKLSIATGTHGDEIRILGRTSTTAGDGPYYASIGPALQTALSFPVTYHTFVFSNEVLLVISSGDEYQWLTFGESQQTGLSGTGNFYGASLASNVPATFTMVAAGGFYAPAIFWGNYYGATYGKNCFVHSDLDGDAWWPGLTTSDTIVTGAKYLYDLISVQPNSYNQETILLPIKAFKNRGDSNVSQTLEIENARHLRNDNYVNEEIVTIGLDSWMIFPCFKKNIDTRDGGSALTHSGTFGFAVKYEGP